MSTNPIKAQLDAAQALDRRRQNQIQNQVRIIDRLMEGDATYDKAFQALQDELLDAQETIEALRAQLAEPEPKKGA